MIMPNLSPLAVREKYMLYDGKSISGDDAGESLDILRRHMQEIGYELQCGPGRLYKEANGYNDKNCNLRKGRHRQVHHGVQSGGGAVADGLRVMQIGCDPKADSTTQPAREAEDRPRCWSWCGSARTICAGGHGLCRALAACMCVEAGGPTPGLGCAGRGIVAALDKLTGRREPMRSTGRTLFIYDVLGDVVCGGFSMPMRKGYADQVFVVTSGREYGLFTRRPTSPWPLRISATGGMPLLGGLILNRRNVKNEQQKVEELAQELGTGIVGTLDHSDLVTQAEELGKTVLEAFPDSDMAQQYRDLAESLLRACREGGARV